MLPRINEEIQLMARWTKHEINFYFLKKNMKVNISREWKSVVWLEWIIEIRPTYKSCGFPGKHVKDTFLLSSTRLGTGRKISEDKKCRQIMKYSNAFTLFIFGPLILICLIFIITLRPLCRLDFFSCISISLT